MLYSSLFIPLKISSYKSSIFLLAVSYSCASAQIKKGSIYIDGTVNYNKGDLKFGNNNFSTNSGVVTISPGVGYFLTNNLVIGLGLDFQSYNSSSSFTRTDSIINADKSVINYLLKSGIGSRKSAGFGFAELLSEGGEPN